MIPTLNLRTTEAFASNVESMAEIEFMIVTNPTVVSRIFKTDDIL